MAYHAYPPEHSTSPLYQSQPQHDEPHPQGQLVKIFCKADKTYCLSARNDMPLMAPARSDDPSQLWIKDMSFGERIKDNYGSPAFMLVNQATRKALKHGKQQGKQLSMVDFHRAHADEDLLFTESQDFGEGFCTLRMASDTLLNMTVHHEEEKGGLLHHAAKGPEVREGAPLVLDTWHKKDHQLWKLFPLS
ncbi:hypothetical protein KP509_01G019700 [Ceratopteris richardii]|uniref:Uncharacterized protein n=1 Tax=Ceratopteris richardii TaxID=49495 RepID=A0A8T2VE84_CERRI|nr:hypothetical protein KP509_01G019700 [Ceratopteris richardii]